MNILFAWRYFKAKKSANAINIIAWVTVGVIAFATMCQILVLSVFNGFEDLVKSLYASFYTDIKIIPSNGKTVILTHEQINLLKKIQGVSAISMIAEEKALLKNEDLQTIINLKGVDDNYSSVTGVSKSVTQGSFNTGNIDNPGLIIGIGIQNAIAAGVQGEGFRNAGLNIILPKKTSASIADPLQSLSEGIGTATGVFIIQQEFDNKYAITNIDFVKQQMGLTDNEYSAAEIKLNSDIDVEKTQEQISLLLGKNYKVETKYQQNKSLYNTMRLEKWAIFAILTLILIIAAFNMLSALTMLVLEKQKDINILQSMGADKSRILKIFLSEGLLLGGIGAATGIVLATIICLLQIKFKFIKLQGGTFLIDYFPVKLQLTDFILVSGTVMLIALIASLIPARKASMQNFELR